MKTANPKITALYAAVAAAIITGAVDLLFINLIGTQFPVFAVSATLVFGGVYLLVYLLLTNFILKRITPIYNTIFSLKEAENKHPRELDKNELIEGINREVEDWATNKTREIDHLKEMENYRKEFLDNISHEMKSPLFNVQGYVHTLLDGALEDPENNRKFLEKAERNISRLINIVNDLDTISRLDSGEIKIKFENFDILDLAREVFEFHEIRAKKQGIRLILNNQSPGPIIVHADRERIQEVMSNLVVNSINYGREGGYTSVCFTDMGGDILVEIEDSGLGIPNDELPRIFERFYRVDKSRSRNKGGTGLGLAIVKHVIEAHNQSIRAKSTEGAGTTFSFTLRKGNGYSA
jgi:two-component system, OmpR family, phosphate regulon sensor histidine kinase PhoR